MGGAQEHKGGANKKRGEPREPRNIEVIRKLRGLESSPRPEGSAKKPKEPIGEDHKLTAWTRNLTIVTVLLVFVGAIGDGLVYATLSDAQKVSHDQAVDTEKALSIARDQATAADKQATAAIVQGDAAKLTADTAQKEMIANNRAWVGPSNGLLKASPTLGDALAITVQYQNTGREPATDAWIESHPEIAPDGPGMVDKITAYQKACLAHGGGSEVVFPTVGFASGYEAHTSIDGPKIAQAVIDGTDLVWDYGCMVYSTINEVHRSSFCYHTVEVWNAGRTPAIATALRVGWAICGQLPATPTYQHTERLPGGITIRAGVEAGGHTLDPGRFTIELSESEVSDVASDKRYFWMFVEIEFTDFMRESHKAHLCWRWDTLGDNGGTYGPRVVEAPPAYTEQT